MGDTPEFARTALSYRQKDRSAGWYVFAVALHVAVIAALTLFVYHKRSLSEIASRKKTERKMSTERVERLADQLRDLNLYELRAKVKTLLGLKVEIDEIANEGLGVYREFTKKMSAVKGDSAKKMLAELAEKNANLVKAQTEFVAAVNRLAELKVADNPLDMLEEFKKVQGMAWNLDWWQIQAENQMEKILSASSWNEMNAILPEQQRLFVAQIEARQQLDKLRDRTDNLKWSIEQAQGDAERIAKARKNDAELQKTLKEQQAEVEKRQAACDEVEKKVIPELQEISKQKWAEVKKARDEFNANRNNKDKKFVKELQNKVSALEKNAKQAESAVHGKRGELARVFQRDLRNATSAVNGTKHRIQQNMRWVPNWEKNVNGTCDRIRNERGEWVAEAAACQKAQDAVTADQAKLTITANAIQVGGEAVAGVLPQAPEAPLFAAASQVNRLNYAQAYDGAVKLEKQIVRAFRDCRAVDLSMLRELSFAAAKTNIDVPEPDRLQISAAQLLTPPKTTAALDAQKAAIKSSLDEADKMVANCEELLSMLRKQSEELAMETGNPQEENKENNAADNASASSAEFAKAMAELLNKVEQQTEQKLQENVEHLQQVAAATKEAKDAPEAEQKETVEADNKAQEALKEVKEMAEKKPEKKPEPEAVAQELKKMAEKLQEQQKKLETVKVEEEKAQAESARKENKQAEETAKKAAELASAAIEQVKETAKELENAAEQLQALQASASMSKDAAQKMLELESAKLFEKAANEDSAAVADLSALMKEQQKKEQKKEKVLDVKNLTKLVKTGEQCKFPKLSGDTPGVIAGRKIMSRQQAGANYLPSTWMIVDTWYAIGPWPNPNRSNRDRKLPPENMVDLDATYKGIGGETLSWKFCSTPSDFIVSGVRFPAFVAPPNGREYAIYYFYTEIYSDVERDVWFATTSDDKSKIWINNMLVWESGSQQKDVKFGEEGYRRVHLSAGNNEILYRLENGHWGTMFSMCFHINNEPPAMPAPKAK